MRHNPMLLLIVATLPLFAQDRIDDDAARQQWFAQRRAGPDGRVRGYLRLKAAKQMNGTFRVQAARKPGAAAVAGQWTSIGPQAILNTLNSVGHEIWAGRITALAVDQSNADIAYAGASDGGVWWTTNGGASPACLHSHSTGSIGHSVAAQFGVSVRLCRWVVRKGLAFPKNGSFQRSFLARRSLARKDRLGWRKGEGAVKKSRRDCRL